MPSFNLQSQSPIGSFLGAFAKQRGLNSRLAIQRQQLLERKEQNDKMNEFRRETQDRQEKAEQRQKQKAEDDERRNNYNAGMKHLELAQKITDPKTKKAFIDMGLDKMGIDKNHHQRAMWTAAIMGEESGATLKLLAGFGKLTTQQQAEAKKRFEINPEKGMEFVAATGKENLRKKILTENIDSNPLVQTKKRGQALIDAGFIELGTKFLTRASQAEKEIEGQKQFVAVDKGKIVATGTRKQLESKKHKVILPAGSFQFGRVTDVSELTSSDLSQQKIEQGKYLGVAAQSAKLLRTMKRLGSGVTGIRGAVADVLGGFFGQINKDFGALTTRVITGGASPVELESFRSQAQQLIGKSIEPFTGEETGKISEPERRIAEEGVRAKKKLASEPQITAALQNIIIASLLATDRSRITSGKQPMVRLIDNTGVMVTDIKFNLGFAKLKRMMKQSENETFAIMQDMIEQQRYMWEGGLLNNGR